MPRDTYCSECDQRFSTSEELRTHLREDDLHIALRMYNDYRNNNEEPRAMVRCELCDREFATETSLHQHQRDSPLHKDITTSHYCRLCERVFTSEASYRSHMLHSAAHRDGGDATSNSTASRIGSVNADSGSLQPVQGLADRVAISSETGDTEDGTTPVGTGNSVEESSTNSGLEGGFPDEILSALIQDVLQEHATVHNGEGTEPQSQSKELQTAVVLQTPTASVQPPLPAQLMYECPLCFDKKEDLSSIACGHVFCTECINDALDADSRCPLCRKEAQSSDLRRIYFSLTV